MLRKLLALQETSIFNLGIKAATLILASIILFWQDLVIVFNDALHSEVTSYLLAVPLLLTYLIYRKRKILRAVTPIQNKSEPREIRHIPLICGVILSTIAIVFYWHGSYTFTPVEHHMLALPILVAGLTLVVFNQQTLRELAFPIAFLIFLVPPPSEILYTVGSFLAVISSEAANAIVNAFGVPTTITSEYGNPTINLVRPDGTPLAFTIDIACSGVYSLLGFLLFGVFIAYIIRDKTWKKLTILTLGIPLLCLLNIIRITIILTIGYHLGEELALQIFHLIGGWTLTFLGTLLILAISEKIFKTQIFSNPIEKCSHMVTSKIDDSFCLICGRILKPANISLYKRDALKMAAIMITIVLLLFIQAPVFALREAHPLVVVDTPSGQQVSTDILPELTGYTLSFFKRDTAFEAKAKQDMSLIYVYSPLNESENYIWVTIEIASTRSTLHRWETCLITWPTLRGREPKVNQIELKDIELIRNPPIIGRYFAFSYKDTGLIQAILYWYETSTFKIDSTFQQKYVKISVIAYPESINQLHKTEKQLTTFATEIANYWQPIKTWSQITMLISQNGMTLTYVFAIMLTAIVVFHFMVLRRQRTLNTNAYQKLSKLNKQIVDSIIETQKYSTATLNNIAETYRKVTGKKISHTRLLKRLLEIEKTGIIKTSIVNKEDEPFKVWKAQIAVSKKKI